MIGVIEIPAIMAKTTAPHVVPPLGCNDPPSLPAMLRKKAEVKIVKKAAPQIT
jgi:hypothetical protein